MRDHVVVKDFEVGLGKLAVAVPPYGVLGQRIDDGVLVLRAAAGMHAGLGAKGAAVNEVALAVPDGVLDEPAVGEIPVDAGELFEAETLGAVSAVPRTRFLHPSLRSVARAVVNIWALDGLSRCQIRLPAGKRASLYRAS